MDGKPKKFGKLVPQPAAPRSPQQDVGRLVVDRVKKRLRMLNEEILEIVQEALGEKGGQIDLLLSGGKHSGEAKPEAKTREWYKAQGLPFPDGLSEDDDEIPF